MKIISLVKSFGFLIGLSAAVLSVARADQLPFFTLEPAITPPSQMVDGQAAIAAYTVTNNLDKPFTGSSYVHLIPTGNVTQVASTATGACSSPRFTLPAGGHCTLYLKVSGAVSKSDNHAAQICGNIDGSDIYCSVPDIPARLDVAVTQSTTGLPTPQLSGNIVLVPGYAVLLNITNPSSTVTMNDVQVAWPSVISSQIAAGKITVNSSDPGASAASCATLAPGGSCEILVTATSEAELTDTLDISVQGANTQAANFNLQVSTLTYSVDNNLQHLQYIPVKVTNVATSPAEINTLTTSLGDLVTTVGSNSVTNATTVCSNGLTLAAGASCYIWLQANPAALENTALFPKGVGTANTSLTLSITQQGTTAAQQMSLTQAYNTTYDASLYVGGTFNTAGDTTVSNIARWDGQFWHDVGGGVYNSKDDAGGSSVLSLAMYNGDLYAGGWFKTAGGSSLATPVSNLARWDGTSWHNVSGGVAAPVRSLYNFNNVTGSGAAPGLYLTGDFTEAGNGSVAAKHVAYWDGETFHTLGLGLDGGSGLALSPYGDNKIAIGGSFTTAGNQTVNRITIWDGSDFQPLGQGWAGDINALAYANNKFYLGGFFTGYFATWDGNSFTYPLSLSGSVFAIDANHGGYVGGDFTHNGGTIVNRLTTFDGQALGSATSPGVADRVTALASTPAGVYAGGHFTFLSSGIPMDYITYYDSGNQQFNSLDAGLKGVDGEYSPYVWSLLIVPSLTDFTAASTTSANNIQPATNPQPQVNAEGKKHKRNCLLFVCL